MSVLISAPIRTGKTLFSVKCIFDELNKGRMVYTNIVGIKIDGVISVASSPDKPFDWRDLPNGSVLIWDEAHEHPAFSADDLLKEYDIDRDHYDDQIDRINTLDLSITEKKRRIDEVEKFYKKELLKRKEQIKDIGRGLLLHGHFGIEIYFITQRPAKLNADVLASVTTHYVMRRKFGMDASMIWEFGEAMTSWSKSTAEIALNRFLWRYPKHLYKFYVSSENHQVKKSFPAKYLGFAVVPLLLFGYGFSNATSTSFFGLFGDKEEVKTVVADQSKSLPPPQTDSNVNLLKPDEIPPQTEETRVSAVFDMGDRCRAYNGNGDLMQIPISLCKHLASNPSLLKSAPREVVDNRLQAANYSNTQNIESVEQAF